MRNNYFFLILFIYLSALVPTSNILCKAKKKKQKKSKSKIKKINKKKQKQKKQIKKTQKKQKKVKPKKETKNKMKEVSKTPPKASSKTAEQPNQKLKDGSSVDDLLNQKEKMTPQQFGKLLKFWNRYHAEYLKEGAFRKVKKPLTKKSKNYRRKKNINKAEKIIDSINKIAKDTSISPKINSNQKKVMNEIKKEIESLMLDYENKGTLDEQKCNKIISKMDRIYNNLTDEDTKNNLEDLRINLIDFKNACEEEDGEDESPSLPKKEANIIAEAELLVIEAQKTKGLNQDQKNEIKKIKNKIKDLISIYEKKGTVESNEYDLLLKDIQILSTSLDKNENNKSSTVSYIEKINNLKNMVNELKDSYIGEGQVSKRELGKTIATLKKDIQTWETLDLGGAKIIHMGIVFKVQIGAYRKIDLRDKKEKGQKGDLLIQEEVDGIHQYTLRTFRNYWKADKFKKYLRKMGLRDAFIQPYKDGKRINIKQALSIIKKQKINIS